MTTPTITPNNYNDFDPRRYLEEYYATVVPENRELLRFLVESFESLPPDLDVLDFGGGPCLYTALTAARTAGTIIHAEYLTGNRHEVDSWQRAVPAAFDWSETIHAILELERIEPTTAAVAARVARSRTAIMSVIACDAHADPPLAAPHLFDVLVTNLCLEAVAVNILEWRAILKRVVGLIKPGGTLLMTMVNSGYAYPVGDTLFGVLTLCEDDFRAAARDAGLDEASIHVRLTPADHPVHRYDGLLFIRATTSR